MLEIRTARQDELPELKSLFKRSFGDSDEFVDGYYKDYCSPEQTLVVIEDGELISMLTVLDVTYYIPGGEEFPVGYIYGLATNPHIQGKGHARQLMAYADQHLQKLGKKCLALVPASPSLHRYFESLGLVDCFSTRKVEVMSSALRDLPPLDASCKLSPTTPKEYNEIRNDQLAKRLHIRYDEKLAEFQLFCSQLSQGGLYRLEIDGEVGCAAIEYVQKSRLLAKEVLISTHLQDKATQLIFENLSAGRYHIRTPAFWDGIKGSYTQTFGMAKWYDKELQQRIFRMHQDSYFGLAFD